MAGPVNQSLSAYQGDEFSTVNTIENITTDQIAEAWFTIKAKAPSQSAPDDADAVTQVKLSTGGITIVDSASILITIGSALTALWTRKSYVYDTQIRTLAGKEYTLTYGAFIVTPDVTKST